MITLTLLLVLAAFVVCLLSAIGKAPLWVAVLLLIILELVRIVPK